MSQRLRRLERFQKFKEATKKKALAVAVSVGIGMGFKKIDDEFLGIDPRKQEVVRQMVKSGGGGFKSFKAPPVVQYPFSVGEREALTHLHGKAKKRFVKELKLKYFDCRREYV